jgi:hypothetical protein
VFYFEQLLQTALGGIDSRGVMSAVLQIAGTILIVSLLYAVYQAFANGGDVRALAIAGVKYLALGLIFLQYGTVFRTINTAFNSVADLIYSQSGIGDVIGTWLSQLANYVSTNGISSMWGLVTGSIVGFLTTILILWGMIILPITYLLFTVFYAMYGSVLYVLGPFVLALLPVRGIGELARTYAVNLMVFQAWGLIYAILQVLMSAINLDSMNNILNSGGILNGFVGSTQMVLLGVVSILFSISIALIPFIASRIVRGDVGSAVVATMSAAYTASQVAAAAVIGAVGGGQAGLAAAASSGGGTAGSAQVSSTCAPRTVSGSLQGASASSSAGMTAGPLAGSRAPSSLRADTSGGDTGLAVSDFSAPAHGTSEAGATATPAPSTVPSGGQSTSSTTAGFGQPGGFRGFNYTHGAAWNSAYVAGWALGKTAKMIGAKG